MSTANINAGSATEDVEAMAKKLRDDVGYLVTRSGLRVNRQHLFKVRLCFPFEKLPAEIRNKIYRNALVTGFLNIPITDMHYDDYHASGDTVALRTPYWTVSHDDEEATPPTNPNGTWTRTSWTTYFSPVNLVNQHIARETFPILSLNHQIRNEAIPIFYGENCFSFCSEGCIVPFLQDRTLLARTSIRHVRLFFLLSDDGSNNSRQRTWVKNFNYMAANLPHLETLELHIFDSEGRMLIGNTEFARPPVIGGRYMKWVRPLMQITNLQQFILEIELGSYGIFSRSSRSGTYQQEWNAMNKWLSFLEPRMLAPGVKRSYHVPPGSTNIGQDAPPRAYVWETENEDDDDEEEVDDGFSDAGEVNMEADDNTGGAEEVFEELNLNDAEVVSQEEEQVGV